MSFLFWYDYALLPFYLIFIVVYLNSYFKKKYGVNRELKKHFNRALTLKLIGCISVALIYEYYYKGAYDGVSYFEGGKMLAGYWKDNPGEFFHVLFSNLYDFNNTNVQGLNINNAGIFANESFTVCKVTGLLDLVSFDAFLPCSLFYCFFAFMGIWNFFVFLIREYKLPAVLAGFCSIYIPSVLYWDSGIFKDTITFTALMWLFMCSYYVLIKPTKVIANLVAIVVCVLLISAIKVYILAAFTPFFVLYAFNSYKTKITSPGLRVLATPFILVVSAVVIIFFLQNANQLLGKYSADQVIETASRTVAGINSAGEAGSAYSINANLGSLGGFISAIPAGINVTLFRPYPWEYLKPFILFASAESMILLFFTFYLVIKIGIGKLIRTISSQPVLQFCLPFSLFFAFMVGVSSANFGSLVRYKIPCMPFYILFLIMLYLHNVAPQATRKMLSARNRRTARPAVADQP
jgi:hypothetical protein